MPVNRDNNRKTCFKFRRGQKGAYTKATIGRLASQEFRVFSLQRKDGRAQQMHSGSEIWSFKSPQVAIDTLEALHGCV